jgi:hypothetical protein
VFGARKALHEFAEGRNMLCEEIRSEISKRDGRILASRRIRAHLRRCEGCTAFRAMIAEREREFAAMAPPLPAIAAAAMLQGLQGGGGISGGLTGLTAAGTSHALISTAALKAAPILAAAAVGGGAGAVAQPEASRQTARDEPVVVLRAFAQGAGEKAHAAAAIDALRAGVRASPAAGSPRAAPAPKTEPPAAAPTGTTPAPEPPQAPAPAVGAPADPDPQDAAPAPAPPPRPKPAPAPPPAPQPKRAPRPAPKPAPAPPAPAPAPPPANDEDDGEPDDNSDDLPGEPD